MSTTPQHNQRPVTIGDPFPDIEVVDHDGAPWRPSDAAGRPLVMILHRHLA